MNIRYFSTFLLRGCVPSLIFRPALLLLAFCTALASGGAESGKAFSTPEEAVRALDAAVRTGDTNALHVIFGPASEDLLNPDRVQAAEDLRTFTAALHETRRIVHQSDARCVLELGPTLWPFPVPIVRQAGQWFFDAEAGKEELLNRRIGRNELMVLQTVRAYVEAQREYAAEDQDGDDVLEYALKFVSTPGTRDGLYWPIQSGGAMSPLGPLIAEAQRDGYATRSKEAGEASQPFHGYYFKILTHQGTHAPGGRYNYIINGNMIGGFALVAWPAGYGESGIMTFIVNQRGRVLQKDLGAKTPRIAGSMEAYDPDKTWQVSPN